MKVLKDLAQDFMQLLGHRLHVSCPECQLTLAVAHELQGKTTRCACGVLLEIPRKQPPVSRSPISAQLDRIRQLSEKKRAREEAESAIVNMLNAILADGIVTDEEETALLQIAQEHGVDAPSLNQIKRKFAKCAHAQAIDDGKISKEEEEGIDRVCQALAISRDSIIENPDEYQRMRLLAELEAGKLPVVVAWGLMLKSGEVCHHSEKAALLDERVVKHYHLRQRSISISRDGSYRIGTTKGRRVSKRALVGVDSGTFSITSRRFVYTGRSKSYSILFDDILSIQPYEDAISFTVEKRKTPISVGVADGELVAAVCSAVLNKQH